MRFNCGPSRGSAGNHIYRYTSVDVHVFFIENHVVHSKEDIKDLSVSLA